MPKHYNYIIIGSGIIGMTLARELRRRRPDTAILIIDKEYHAGYHASSRNSGVLHAGFYYTANSLKARLTVTGNRMMKAFCREHGLTLNECGKLVVARDEAERQTLHELERRGKVNGSDVTIISAQAAREIEPNVRTYQEALWSPATASVDPAQVNDCLWRRLKEQKVEFAFETRYKGHEGQTIFTNRGGFSADRIINCAGLYAETIAQDYGFGTDYAMIPFKGLYLKYTKNTSDVRVNIYPVPNLRNPFLGVHFTKTVDGTIKIGPTAIPAFWKEQYGPWENFSLKEMLRIAGEEARLFVRNSFGFRDLAIEEMKKYERDYFIKLAADMVQQIDPAGFTEFTKPGIRAQLLNIKTRALVTDFLIEGDAHSLHILNAVSPAYTCSLAFAEMVVDEYGLAAV